MIAEVERSSSFVFGDRTGVRRREAIQTPNSTHSLPAPPAQHGSRSGASGGDARLSHRSTGIAANEIQTYHDVADGQLRPVVLRHGHFGHHLGNRLAQPVLACGVVARRVRQRDVAFG